MDWDVGTVRIGRGALPVAHAGCSVTKGRRRRRFYIDTVHGLRLPRWNVGGRAPEGD